MSKLQSKFYLLTLISLLALIWGGAITPPAVAQVTFHEAVELSLLSGAPSLGLSLDHTSFGTYLAGGFQDLSFNYLAEFNRNGHMLWGRRYQFPLIGYVVEEVAQTNGGFVLGGRFSKTSIFLARTDRSGNVLWAKRYDHPQLPEAYSLDLTDDRGFILTGFTRGDFSEEYPFLLKLDSAGAVEWMKVYLPDDLTNFTRGRFVRQTPDGGYIMTGETDLGGEDVFLLKVNNIGNVEWGKRYGGAAADGGVTVYPKGSAYVLSGNTSSFGAGGVDAYLLEVDALGVLAWSKSYGGTGNESESSLLPLSSGELVAQGMTTSFGAGATDVFLFKTDASGQLSWFNAYGGLGPEWTIDHHSTLAPQEARDGGVVFAALSESLAAAGAALYLVETDPGGDCQCHQTAAEPMVTDAMTVTSTMDFEVAAISPLVVDFTIFEESLAPPVAFECHDSSLCEVTPADLVTWYPLDSSGVDTAGGNTARAVGDPIVVTGMVGGAIALDGTLDSLTAPSHGSHNISTEDFTVDLWLQASVANSGVRSVIEKRVQSPRTRGYTLFLVDGELSFQLADAAGASGTCSSQPTSSCTNYLSGVNLADGQWHFIAVTIDRDNPQGLRWYVDGVEAATPGDPTVRAGSLLNSGPFHIGRHAYQSQRLIGTVDEVEIFRRALSPAEVAAIYHADVRGKCKTEIVPPWDQSLCRNQDQIVANIGICNGDTEPRTYTPQSFKGLFPDPHKDRCSTQGPTLFQWLAPSVTVLPGQCDVLPVRIDRPVAMTHGQIACYEVTIVDDQGQSYWADGSIWKSDRWCASLPGNPTPFVFETLEPQPISLVVENTSELGSTLDYRLTVQPAHTGITDVPVRINDLPAGTDLAGSLVLASGETGAIDFNISMESHVAFAVFHLILNEVGGGGEDDQALLSLAVRSSSAIGDIVFFDGFESGDLSAWSLFSSSSR